MLCGASLVHHLYKPDLVRLDEPRNVDGGADCRSLFKPAEMLSHRTMVT